MTRYKAQGRTATEAQEKHITILFFLWKEHPRATVYLPKIHFPFTLQKYNINKYIHTHHHNSHGIIVFEEQGKATQTKSLLASPKYNVVIVVISAA